MTAARLREAATLLRERAEATTHRAEWSGGHYWIEDYDPNDPSGQTGMQVEIGGMGADGDAAFYSMMAPPVALALADWLDGYAARIEEIHDSLPFSANLTLSSLAITAPTEAVALADAILGAIA